MRISAWEGHRLWAPVYDTTPNPLLTLEGRILPCLLPRTPVRVLDVGCGTGRWASYFARCGAISYGVDNCEEMLAQAARHHWLKSRLALADAGHLPFRSGIVDLVICSFAVSYFSELPQVLSEMARVSAPGACAVISDMHPAAIAAGWSRSFRAGTFQYEIETSKYTTAELETAATAAGLRLMAHFKAAFGETERSIFERAGKQHLFKDLSAVPAVWIGIWRKP